MAKKSRSSTGDALWAYWKPRGIVNKSHAKALQQWLKKNAAGIDIATFIHSSEHDKKHPKAVSALLK